MKSLDLKGKVKSIKEKFNMHKKQPNYYNSFFLIFGEKIPQKNMDYLFV